MPSIHVSEDVMEKIEERMSRNESPTDVIRRAFEQEREFYERIVEEKIEEMKRY